MTDSIDSNKFLGEPCRKCGECLRYRNKSRQCVACKRRRKSRPDVKALDAQWRKDNPEKVRAIRARYVAKDPEKEAERKRVYSRSSAGKATARRTSQKNRDRRLLRQSAYNKVYRQTVNGVIRHRSGEGRRRARAKGNGVEFYTPQQLRDRFTIFGDACAYCGVMGQLTADHVVAIARGGKDAIENIVPACERCNFSKKDRAAWEWYQSQSFFDWYLWNIITENVDRV